MHSVCLAASTAGLQHTAEQNDAKHAANGILASLPAQLSWTKWMYYRVHALHSLGSNAPVFKPALGASSNLKSSQGRLQAAKSATFSGPSVRHLWSQGHMHKSATR